MNDYVSLGNHIVASAFGFYENGSLRWKPEVYLESGPDKMHLSRTSLWISEVTYVDPQEALKASKDQLMKGMIKSV